VLNAFVSKNFVNLCTLCAYVVLSMLDHVDLERTLALHQHVFVSIDNFPGYSAE
jgi:hypothetical protein